MPSLMPSQQKAKMPNCLPRNRPRMMPSGAGSDSFERDAGIYKSEEWQNSEGDSAVKVVFELLDRGSTRLFTIVHRDERREQDTGECGVHS